MKRLVLTYLLLLSISFAQGEIFGKVINQETGERVPFARVMLETGGNSAPTGALADEYGRFQFKKLKSGKYLLRVSCIYHKSVEKEVEVKDGLVEITVELEDTPSVRGMINKVNYMLNVEGE